jgi:GNAT superfamily N-acetyltransferase
VHVLEDPQQISQATAREKQGGVSRGREACPAPGLLAFNADRAVGWCQLTPRDDLPWLDRAWRLKRVDEVPVWSLSCFYVRKGYRQQGVTSALIAAALKAAKRAKAPALEAYPLDADQTPSASGTGYASTFARAGFKIIARRVPPRPIMRHDLRISRYEAPSTRPENQEGRTKRSSERRQPLRFGS